MHIVGVVLAGGASSRMGTDKSILDLGGKTVIEHICNKVSEAADETILITNKPEIYYFLDIPSFKDIYLGKGPLAGLHSAMHHKPGDAYILTACDMPLIEPDICKFLVSQLGDHDAVLPVFGEKKQPLAAVYSRKVMKKAEELLQKDMLKIGLLFGQLNTVRQTRFPFPDQVLEKHFFNMNHPHEYELAKTHFEN